MVQQAKLQPRLLTDIQFVDRLESLQQTQEMKRAVQRAHFTARGNDNHRAVSDLQRTDAEPLRPKIRKLSFPTEGRYLRRTLQRSCDNSAITVGLIRDGNSAAEQSGATVD